MPSLIENGKVKAELWHGVKPSDIDFSGGTTIYLCGPRRIGKSSLAAHFSTANMLPQKANEKIKALRAEVEILRAGGFNKLDVSELNHLVYADIKMTAKNMGYATRISHDLFPDKMRLPEEGKKNQFFAFGSLLVITEASSKFDNRNSTTTKRLPEGVCRFIEWAGHAGIDMILDCQRSTSTDIRIRSLANLIILICHREIVVEGGKIKTRWYCLNFPDCEAWEDFEKTKNLEQATPAIYEHNGNIHACYNSVSYKPHFLRGMENRNFDFGREKEVALNAQSINDYCEKHSFKMPEDYYDKTEKNK